MAAIKLTWISPNPSLGIRPASLLSFLWLDGSWKIINSRYRIMTAQEYTANLSSEREAAEESRSMRAALRFHFLAS